MNMFERKTYYEDDDIRVYLENINDNVFIHVGIFNMSKNILSKIKEKWAEVAIKMYFLGYEELFAYTKDRRIINLIGGAEKIGQEKDYEVYKWDLRQ
jgi:hypothetical protein